MYVVKRVISRISTRKKVEKGKGVLSLTIGMGKNRTSTMTTKIGGGERVGRWS